jgi:tRNA G37 N-methylase Trm5
LLDLANEFGEVMKEEKSRDIETIDLIYASKVKSYAPHVFHYVFDFKITFKN